MGMRQRLGQRDGFTASLQRVRRIAQIPQGQGDMSPAADPQTAVPLDVVREADARCVVPCETIQGDALVEIRSRRGECSQIVKDY
jgi:hypothetical protein